MADHLSSGRAQKKVGRAVLTAVRTEWRGGQQQVLRQLAKAQIPPRFLVDFTGISWDSTSKKTGWKCLEHEFYDFPYIGNVIIPTDFCIFLYFSEG